VTDAVAVSSPTDVSPETGECGDEGETPWYSRAPHTATVRVLPGDNATLTAGTCSVGWPLATTSTEMRAPKMGSVPSSRTAMESVTSCP